MTEDEDEATFEAHLEGRDCGKRPCNQCAAVTPNDPIGSFSELMAMAVQLHELKQTFVAAGFTEDQAMSMVQHILSDATRGAHE